MILYYFIFIITNLRIFQYYYNINSINFLLLINKIKISKKHNGNRYINRTIKKITIQPLLNFQIGFSRGIPQEDSPQNSTKIFIPFFLRPCLSYPRI